MKMFLFSVFDKVAEEYGPVFEAKNKGVALRQFKKLLDTVVVENRGDYVMYMFGFFDHDAGVMTALEQGTIVAYAGDCDPKEDPNV